MKSNIKRGESAVVLGMAAVLITLCVLGLGAFLARANAVETGVVEDEHMEISSVSDEVQAPEGFTVKVDTRGIELPEGNVSAQYAVAVTAEIAERVYQQEPTGRAIAVLYNSETHIMEEYDTIHGLHWSVQLQTITGKISATIVAASGVDISLHYSPFPEDWAFFDEWDDKVAGSSMYGTEQDFLAGQAEMVAQYGENRGRPFVSEEEQAEANARKRAIMEDSSAENAGLPHLDQALQLVNEYDLGNGAVAISAKYAAASGGGPVGGLPDSYYIVDVTLDDGAHLYVGVGEQDLQLRSYERNNLDFLTFHYGD